MRSQILPVHLVESTLRRKQKGAVMKTNPSFFDEKPSFEQSKQNPKKTLYQNNLNTLALIQSQLIKTLGSHLTIISHSSVYDHIHDAVLTPLRKQSKPSFSLMDTSAIEQGFLKTILASNEPMHLVLTASDPLFLNKLKLIRTTLDEAQPIMLVENKEALFSEAQLKQINQRLVPYNLIAFSDATQSLLQKLFLQESSSFTLN